MSAIDSYKAIKNSREAIRQFMLQGNMDGGKITDNILRVRFVIDNQNIENVDDSTSSPKVHSIRFLKTILYLGMGISCLAFVAHVCKSRKSLKTQKESKKISKDALAKQDTSKRSLDGDRSSERTSYVSFSSELAIKPVRSTASSLASSYG